MGYTILYDSIGIKFKKDNLYLTLSKSGCSNVFSEPNKRHRSWSFWSPLGTKPFKKQAIIKEIEYLRLSIIESNKKDIESYEDWSTYSDSSFGYFASVSLYGKNCATTTYKQYYNYYIKDDAKCIWFEDFTAKYLVYVEVPSHCIPKELEGSVKSERIYVKSEQDLFNAIEYFSCNYIGMDFYIQVDLPEYRTSKDILSIFGLSTKRIKKPKQQIEVDKFYTIMFGNNFFKKRTSRSIVYSYYNPQIKIANEKQAIAKLNKVARGDDRFSIKLINQKTIL